MRKVILEVEYCMKHDLLNLTVKPGEAFPSLTN